jgi:hypothetical protein
MSQCSPDGRCVVAVRLLSAFVSVIALLLLSLPHGVKASAVVRDWPAERSHVVVRSIATECHACTRTVFIVCGIHGREPLTAELCERWARRLHEPHFHSSLRFVIVPRLNEAGLFIAAEEGNSCWRGNGAGVDLNRNWPRLPMDINERPVDNRGETDPGPKPLSEPEVRALLAALRFYKPDMLLAVHSGTEALFYPYDASTPLSREAWNRDDHVRMANWMRSGICDDCIVTRALEVLYPASGTLTDYWYHHDTNCDISLTLEIYGPPAGTNTSALTCRQLFAPTDSQEREQLLQRWDGLFERLARIAGENLHSFQAMTRRRVQQ